MALPKRVRGALRPSTLITWYREGTTAPEDLTNATLTGFIQNIVSGTTVAIAGTLTVVDGEAGQFRWDYATDDLATVGDFNVQFNAAFGTGQTPAKTFVARMTVVESLSAP